MIPKECPEKRGERVREKKTFSLLGGFFLGRACLLKEGDWGREEGKKPQKNDTQHDKTEREAMLFG
jgi:hypothetical protein